MKTRGMEAIRVGTFTPTVKLHISSGPEYKSQVFITPTFTAEFTYKCPNWWHRFWFWVLLGWRWERLEESESETPE